MTDSLHSKCFPGESAAYRTARDELLVAEMALRRQTEAVAALRRKLPPGGAVPEDYVFDGPAGKVRLSELFKKPAASLVIYSYMYGPDVAQPCPMCTCMLDGLDGQAPHILQRINLAVVAKSPLPRILEFAQARGWRNLPLLSSAGNSYNRDYFAEDDKGAQDSTLNIFARKDGVTRHSFATELAFGPRDPGMHPRHVDSIWPVWNVFDLTPEGRGTDWFPSLSYG
jgi:predicted dithiol-disulfide oxidoreductase (DUF899 family)